MEKIKKVFKGVVLIAVLFCLICILPADVQGGDSGEGKVVIDLLKLAPFAAWRNYYGKTAFKEKR